MAIKSRSPLSIVFIVVSVIGLVLWTCCVYLGLYFASSGSTGLSIPLSVCLGAAMGLFFFLMRRYTVFAQDRYRVHDSRRLEWIFFGLYMLVALGSAWFVLHSVAVTTTIKTGKKTVALDELGALYHVTDTLKPAGSYPEYVDGEVARYRQAHSETAPQTLDAQAGELRDMLTRQSGFTGLQTEVKEFWQRADWTVREWNLQHLPSTAKHIHDKYKVWSDSLARCSDAAKAKFDNKPYAMPANVREEAALYESFTSVTKADFSGWSIPLVLVLQLLILSSWLGVMGSGRKRPEGIAGSGANYESGKPQNPNPSSSGTFGSHRWE